MKLLVVVSHSPFPPRSGSTIVAYNILRCLSARHGITFLCLQPAGESIDVPGFLETAEFVSQTQVSGFVKGWQRRFGKLRGIPAIVSGVKSNSLSKRVREFMEHSNFDAILLFAMEAIQYCPEPWYHKVIAFVEDPPSIKLSRLAELPVWSLWEKLHLSFTEHITRRYERQFLPRMGKVLLLSEADMQDMQEQDGYDNLGVVPYGVTTMPEDQIPGYGERTEGMIVFSGNMFHPPNVDGALNFLRTVFSLVLQQYATAQLWIVGADPDTRIREEAARFGERVIITGWVNDVSEYLRRARVSICPVRLKIGCQTKVLEALSCGTPVVTTSAGNSGIRGGSGRELWVEDESAEFAGRIAALLRGEGWHQLSANGRKFIEEYFPWERSAGAVEKHIESV
jgi:glycosyltransferase involved in cell wall biosynthesis